MRRGDATLPPMPQLVKGYKDQKVRVFCDLSVAVCVEGGWRLGMVWLHATKQRIITIYIQTSFTDPQNNPLHTHIYTGVLAPLPAEGLPRDALHPLRRLHGVRGR